MDRVALVTGGSRGFGRAVAIGLGRAGYGVCVNYVQDEASAEETVRDIGPGSFMYRADVAQADEVGRMMDEISSRWGRLDLAVNNAGIGVDGLALKLSAAEWDRVLRVNLGGCVNVIRAAVPYMARAGGGHVVNISSRSGARGMEGQAAYAASKAAILGLTLSSARELAPLGVRVNALLPGYMPTELGSMAAEAMERAREESLLGELSDPVEAASFVVWLAATERITGQVFTLDSRI